MSRYLNRPENQLRPVSIKINTNMHAEGSCTIQCGDTIVVCTATIEEKVPTWMKNTGMGWITAEYGMLPRSTQVRMDREAKKGQAGRTHEIQRLIGRSLRAGVDLKGLNGFCIKMDCDVIQADGGTRTASITGGFVALYLACLKLVRTGKIPTLPITQFVAAVSCGIVRGQAMLDLDYDEDSCAGTDSNFVMTDRGALVEVQATAEHGAFKPAELTQLIELADQGIKSLIVEQKKALGILK